MSGTRSLIRHSSLIRHLNPFDSARVTRITRQSLISNRLKREKEREIEKRKKYMGKEKKENEREVASMWMSNDGSKERSVLN